MKQWLWERIAKHTISMVTEIHRRKKERQASTCSFRHVRVPLDGNGDAGVYGRTADTDIADEMRGTFTERERIMPAPMAP